MCFFVSFFCKNQYGSFYNAVFLSRDTYGLTSIRKKMRVGGEGK